MKKKIIIISISVIITIFIVNFFVLDEDNDKILFHITLADPALYNNGGVYTDIFTINDGEYYFRFVPNGSSPEILSITMKGKNFNFYEDFKLEGTSHKTEISEYFTWEYVGQKNIWISEMQEISITINPNGNIMGSVSVDILEN